MSTGGLVKTSAYVSAFEMSSAGTRPWLADIPPVDEIVEEAVKELIREMKRETGREGLKEDEVLKTLKPYQAMERLELKCREIYNRHEQQVREKFGRGAYGSVDPKMFENSLANARRARAGATLEKIFLKLLNVYGISYKKHVRMGEAEFDFAIPSGEQALRNPHRSVLISLKREVRERWKLTVGDAYILRQKYGYPVLENIWFASLGEPPLEAIAAMTALCIVTYVPNDHFNVVSETLRKRGDLTDREIARIRRFSRIIEDALRVTRDEIPLEPCVIEQRKLERYKSLLGYISR